MLSITTVLITLVTLTLWLPDYTNKTSGLIILVGALILFTGSIVTYLRSRELITIFLTFALNFVFVWSVLLTVYYQPFIPFKIKELVQENPVGVVLRKPFYVQEVIQRRVEVLDPAAVYTKLETDPKFYIVHKDLYDERNLSKVGDIIYEWPVWRRGRKLPEIIKAIRLKNLDILKENIVLLKSKSYRP